MSTRGCALQKVWDAQEKKNGLAAQGEPERTNYQMEMVSATSSRVVSMLLCIDSATLMS